MKYKSQIKVGESSNTAQKKNILHLEGPFLQTSKLEDFSIHCWCWQGNHPLISLCSTCSFPRPTTGGVSAHPSTETQSLEKDLGPPGCWWLPAPAGLPNMWEQLPARYGLCSGTGSASSCVGSVLTMGLSFTAEAFLEGQVPKLNKLH